MELRRENNFKLRNIVNDLEALQIEKKKTENRLDVLTKQLSDSLMSIEMKNKLIKDLATKLADMENNIIKKN